MEQAKEIEKRGPGRPPNPKKSSVLDQILAPEPDQKFEKPVEEAKVVPGPKNLTPEELAIYGRVMAESDEWKTITEEESNDFSLSRDPFELPDPAKKLRDDKQFAFRWITRSSARLDEIRNKPIPFRWWVVNSNQPVGGLFKPFIDPNNGCVSREDQMLVFKPYWMFEKELDHKRRLADAWDQGSSLESKDGQKRKGGRDSDVEITAGKRKGTDTKQLRQEVKGSDVEFRGEEEVDIDAGRSFSAASESDLTIEE